MLALDLETGAERQPVRGRPVFEARARISPRQRVSFRALTETQRGDLYTWLKETYPGRQDPHPALNDSVRYLGQSGEHILTRSFTARDPKRAAG